MQGLGISYFRGGAKYTDAMRYNIKGKKSMPTYMFVWIFQ